MGDARKYHFVTWASAVWIPYYPGRVGCNSFWFRKENHGHNQETLPRVGSGAIRSGFARTTTGEIRKLGSSCPRAAPNDQRPHDRLELLVQSRPSAATWENSRR